MEQGKDTQSVYELLEVIWKAMRQTQHLEQTERNEIVKQRWEQAIQGEINNESVRSDVGDSGTD